MALDSDELEDSFVHKADRPWPNARLKTAAVVGHATSTSVRLWFRTGRPGRFCVVVYPLDRARAVRARLRAVPVPLRTLLAQLPRARSWEFSVEDYRTDTTHVADIPALEADTRYGYLLYDCEGERVALGHNRARSFRTPPPESERRRFQFALFSCHMPYAANGLFTKRTEVANVDMWDFLGATLERHGAEVDLVLAGGDQCYSDGVATLDIWRHLNRTMRRDGGNLRPGEEAMLSWYRDIHRGYWGFESVQRVFDGYPTYMVWDDHEIGDGWGSHYLHGNGARGVHRLLPALGQRGLTVDDGRRLAERMFSAATRAYVEYQHSHNPHTPEGTFDYHFRRGGCAFYVLDGRGHRDVERSSFRILGRPQYERFAAWAASLDPEETPFAFVASAVPVVHTRAALVNADGLAPIRAAGLDDDLRDSWEHELHDEERRALLAALFAAAERGVRVSIVSGDVHVSAVFALEDAAGNRIHQLTSSAVTYNISRVQSWVLRGGTAEAGTCDGYAFRRLALYTGGSYALVSVDPRTGESWFKLYGRQSLAVPPGVGEAVDAAVTHSLARIRLY